MQKCYAQSTENTEGIYSCFIFIKCVLVGQLHRLFILQMQGHHLVFSFEKVVQNLWCSSSVSLYKLPPVCLVIDIVLDYSLCSALYCILYSRVLYLCTVPWSYTKSKGSHARNTIKKVTFGRNCWTDKNTRWGSCMLGNFRNVKIWIPFSTEATAVPIWNSLAQGPARYGPRCFSSSKFHC